MRIIAGRLGGLHFASPKSQRTHPMAEKVVGALFNALGDIEELTVLDAFAGSGALSFESISRGAKSALAIDNDHQAAQAIADNIVTLQVSAEVTLVQANVNAWMETNQSQTFDIVLCDPPYDDMQLRTIQKLSKHVVPEGLLVLSWPGHQEPPELGLQQIERRSYGDAQLIFYRA